MRTTSAASLSAPRRTVLSGTFEKLAFGLLCAFLASQWIGLPVLLVGPSWAIWPTLPDLMLWGAGLCAALYRLPMSNTSQRAVWHLFFIVLFLSLCGLSLLFVHRDPGLGLAVNWGVFALYRLLQVGVALFVASRLLLGAARWATLERVVRAAFWLLVVTIAWSSFSPTLRDLAGSVLPRGGFTPWEWGFYTVQERGLGLVGINHGYPALVVLVTAGLLLHLRARRGLGGREWILVVTLLTCFLTNSRAGLFGAVVLAALEFRRVPARGGVLLTAFGMLGILFGGAFLTQLTPTLQRQSTVLDPLDPRNLSGRVDIWQSFLTTFVEDPIRLLVGSGLGSAVNMTVNAHMMYLQALYEGGIVGLFVLLAALGAVLWLLWKRGRVAEPMWHTTIALIVTGTTQETFYPCVAFPGFLPLFAAALALTLAGPDRRDGRGRAASPAKPKTSGPSRSRRSRRSQE